MRAVYQLIQLREGGSFICRSSSGTRFSGGWHFHPEIEFLLVEHSRGLRFIGDSVAPFREGDLTMIGPNLPHLFLNENLPQPTPDNYATAICIQFREDCLGDVLWKAVEFTAIAELLRRSKQGLNFTGAIARKAARHMRRMVRCVGPPRIAEFILLLDILAQSSEAELLSSTNYVPQLNGTDIARINAACRYVDENLSDEISQKEAARLARLSPATFSRFFRQKMGRTFSTYINELRIARTVHFMVEEDMNISEAAFASGFNNLSNFNLRFRKLKGMSPRVYLKHMNSVPQRKRVID